MLSSAQITIRDELDWIVSPTAPQNPAVDTLWMDTSVTPHVLKRWDGSAWVSVGPNLDDYYTKTELETRFTQTDEALSLKADSSTVTALSTRVSAAEQKVTADAIVSTVRSSALYQYDLYEGRNYVLNSNNTHMFVDNYYRYANGTTSTYTGWTMSVSEDLFAHSGNAANIRMSFDIKRINVASTASGGAYTGVWVYYRYLGEDGVTVYTTGRGWLLRTTDLDFISTDSDWVRVTRGPLNLAPYAPISIAYFQYGTTSSAGTTGTVQFRNVKLEVGNSFTAWSAAPEDLGGLPNRMSSAETSITQNANNIALKVNTSTYDTEKVYRGLTAPASPIANMLWLDTSVSPNLLKRYTGSAWVAMGAQELKTSGIYIGPSNVTITTEQFLLQLLDPANNENVLMEMSADGKVGFKDLYADNIYSDSLASAYSGPAVLYVNPSYASGGTQYFPSLGEAVKAVNNKCLNSDVLIYLPSGVTNVYETSGIHLRGITGPGRLIISGYTNSTLNSYITIIGCQAYILFQYVRLRESRGYVGGTNRNSYLVECRMCHFVELNGCTLDANATTYDSVYCAAGNMALYNCGLYNALQGLEVYRGMAQINYCRGSCTYSMIAYAGIIFAYDTVPAGTRASGENGVVYATGVTIDYGTAIPTISPDTVTYQYATLTRSYRGGWRTDTLDVVQGLYSDYGYSSSLSWNYGCMWFGNLRSVLSGRTIKSATLTLYRLTGSGSSLEKMIYLWAITNTTASGAPSMYANFGALGTIGRAKQVTFAIPVSAVQGLANGTYGGLCLYESPYNFGSSTYSDCYMRMGGTDTGYTPYLTVVYN